MAKPTRKRTGKTESPERSLKAASGRTLPGRRSQGLHPGEKRVRKNHFLYQSKLDLARKLLGVATETEALDAALDLAIYGEALAQGTESLSGVAYNDVLGIAQEIPDARESA